MLTGCMTKEDEEREILFDSINNDLVSTGLIPSSWKYVDQNYSWGGEMPNHYEINYIYIEKDLYDEYKYYWLEDIDDSEYEDGLNKSLVTTGDKVFYDVCIYDLGENLDGKYGGVSTIPDTRYFLITIYDNVLYYTYVSVVGEDSYGMQDMIDKYDANIIKGYLAHQEDNKWIYEEVNIR